MRGGNFAIATIYGDTDMSITIEYFGVTLTLDSEYDLDLSGLGDFLESLQIPEVDEDEDEDWDEEEEDEEEEEYEEA